MLQCCVQQSSARSVQQADQHTTTDIVTYHRKLRGTPNLSSNRYHSRSAHRGWEHLGDAALHCWSLQATDSQQLPHLRRESGSSTVLLLYVMMINSIFVIMSSNTSVLDFAASSDQPVCTALLLQIVAAPSNVYIWKASATKSDQYAP